ncbi:BolA/IbaG family iron-sulfur metabolism protein, partial [Vibrio cholerae O1]|uniref:BolA family protein n=1 Tax=Vibrio cholerae TaxID=666 RepID=UPI001C10F4F5
CGSAIERVEDEAIARCTGGLVCAAHLEVIDESHLHAGHAGAKGGASHFRLIISSPKFTGLNTLARHRLVYDRVTDLMPHPIHA